MMLMAGIATDTINVLSPLSVVKDSTAVTCNGLSDGFKSIVTGAYPLQLSLGK